MRIIPFLSVMSLSVTLASITSCQSSVSQTETLLPDIYLSDYNLDFGEVAWGSTEYRTVYVENKGELPMGVHEIKLEEEGFESSFSLTYYTAAITCADQSVLDVQDAEDWNPNLSEGDFLLFPGCRLGIEVGYKPDIVGDAYASVYVQSFIEEPAEDASGSAAFKPSFYRDPVHFKETIMLHGSSSLGKGNIKVSPRTLDFGHLWTEESYTKQVVVQNVGDGDLLLGLPYLGSDCVAGDFQLNLSALDPDYRIPAGESTVFEVKFTASSIEGTSCTIMVPSDDADSPMIEVRLKGNIGVDPNNQAPRVSLIYPQPGYVHNSSDPLRIQMSIFDVNQPADSLFCKVKSLTLDVGAYNCAATNANGYVEVEIPFENLVPGVDTWLITVTDQSELQSFASTTVLFGTTFPDSDDDGDGYGTEGDVVDCDDTNATVYPNAAELVDGLDNDCDLLVDERTLAGDDDGDSVSELDGDCDDNDPESYPGAPEQPDLKDNDCDGVVDERTSLSDDDGDGFSEVDNDCNDRNPDINPAAVEICDGIDNNCNNLRDQQEGCVTIDSEPVLIGGIQMSARAISVGESTTMTVFVHEEDGQDIEYLWKEDSVLTANGHIAISDPTAKTITWTAPPDVSGQGQAFSVYVLISDEDGNQDWVFDEISVYPAPVPQVLVSTVSTQSQGCGSSSSTALLLPLLPLVALGLRRRKAE